MFCFHPKIPPVMRRAPCFSFGVVSSVLLFIVEAAEPASGISRRSHVQIQYAMFERKSKSYHYRGNSIVKATSDQNMQVVWDGVRDYVKRHLNDEEFKGHGIKVYKVWGSNFSPRI